LDEITCMFIILYWFYFLNVDLQQFKSIKE